MRFLGEGEPGVSHPRTPVGYLAKEKAGSLGGVRHQKNTSAAGMARVVVGVRRIRLPASSMLSKRPWWVVWPVRARIGSPSRAARASQAVRKGAKPAVVKVASHAA